MAAIILAGGKGKRLGGVSKALYPVAGKPLIDYVTDNLRLTFGQLILVTNEPELFPRFPGVVTTDIRPGYGPLSGIEAGLTVAGQGQHFVTGCDMPFLNRDLIRHLQQYAGEYDIVVPRLGHYIEPLHAFYSYDVLPSIVDLLRARNYRLNALLTAPLKVLYVNEHEVRRYDPDLSSFFNLNTIADVNKAEQMLRRKEELSGAH